MKILYRAAGDSDHAATRALVDAAFAPDGPETAAFLDALRADGCVLGEWLAEDGGELVGVIVFSRVWLDTPGSGRQGAAMLTPLAVRQDRRNQGIGAALIEHAVNELEERGEHCFFVIGHPGYYPRAGFSARAARSVECQWSGEDFFMARSKTPPCGRLVAPAVIADAH